MSSCVLRSVATPEWEESTAPRSAGLAVAFGRLVRAAGLEAPVSAVIAFR